MPDSQVPSAEICQPPAIGAHQLRGIAEQRLALSEREFVDAVKVEDEAPDAVFAAVIDVVVIEVIVVGKIERAGPGKVALELEAAGEAFLAAKLERVELDGGIVGEVFDGLSPTELGIVQAALIRAEGAESDDAGLVDVVVRPAGGDVVAVVADVSDGENATGRDLAFDGEIPGIDNGEAHGVVAGKRKNIGRNAVREDGISVRAFRLSCQDGGRGQRRRTLGEREDGEPGIGRVDGLIRQDGEILGDVVAKGDTEDPDIIRAAVPSADDGLGVELVGDAEAWGEVLV